jgi:hypothetical protein
MIWKWNNPECAFKDRISMDLWDLNPKPNMVDSGGHLIVPTTEKGADYKIPFICNYIKIEVCPWLAALKNMDIILIDKISGLMKRNPIISSHPFSFSYPFYICLYVARLHGISFESFRSMFHENMSKNFKGYLELARSMLK